MTRSVPVGAVRPFGDRALLIGVEDAVAGRRLVASLEAALTGSDVELVGGLATVCLLVRDDDAALPPLEAAVRAVLDAEPPARSGHEAPADGAVVTIPCAFDGPDLDEVAQLTALSTDEVVAQLTAAPLTVSVVGFSPGFAYLDGLSPALAAVPRRRSPRPAVPAGSVALANGHAAVYPTASPGGWQLLGRTAFPLFRVDEPPYAVLAPGDRVRFRVAAAGEPVDPPRHGWRSWAPPGGRPVLEILAPGLRAVIQDGGRRGVAASGVPAAGAADPVSRALANRLAGNPEGAAVLEVTGGGTRLRALDTCHVAVAGAAPAVRVDGTELSAGGRLVPLEAGQLLEIGALARGCRTYVAVAGGLVGHAFFGSSSSDELCGLGRGPLRAGANLYAGDWAPPLGDHLAAGAATELPAAGPVALRVVPGPHAERFDPGVLERMAATAFVATNDSNRVGLRLRAAAAVDWGGEAAGELDSQPMVTGAVQVPPGGEPIVLGPDHATLGGYPVAAVVIAADHGVLGQCGPGTAVRFVPVGFAAAEEARARQRRLLAGAVEGHYPLAAG